MITVTLSNIAYDQELTFIDADSLIAVTVEGHALLEDIAKKPGFDAKKGENIACAAVSYAALTLLKSIRIIIGISFEYAIEDGFLQFRISLPELDQEKKKILKILLESFIIGLLDIKQKYVELIKLDINHAR